MKKYIGIALAIILALPIVVFAGPSSAPTGGDVSPVFNGLTISDGVTNSFSINSSGALSNPNGSVAVNDHLKALSIGTFTIRRGSTVDVASQTFALASSACDVNEKLISCGYWSGFSRVHALTLATAVRTCQTRVYNPTSQPDILLVDALCFNPNS
jgi:hypothetical protein